MTHCHRFDPVLVGQSSPFRCWAAALASRLDCIYRPRGKVTNGKWTASDDVRYKVMEGMTSSRDTLGP